MTRKKMTKKAAPRPASKHAKPAEDPNGLTPEQRADYEYAVKLRETKGAGLTGAARMIFDAWDADVTEAEQVQQQHRSLTEQLNQVARRAVELNAVVDRGFTQLCKLRGVD